MARVNLGLEQLRCRQVTSVKESARFRNVLLHVNKFERSRSDTSVLLVVGDEKGHREARTLCETTLFVSIALQLQQQAAISPQPTVSTAASNATGESHSTREGSNGSTHSGVVCIPHTCCIGDFFSLSVQGISLRGDTLYKSVGYLF